MPQPGDAGKFVTVSETEDGFELAPYSVIGVGDYVQYQASGALNGTTGSVDWSTPTASSEGTSVVLDDSTAWVNDWGYAVPLLSPGTYAITVKMQVNGASADSVFTPGLLGDGGVSLQPWEGYAVPSGEGLTKASACWVVNVPAGGARLDWQNSPAIGTGGTLDLLTVTIQRVA